MRRGTDNAEKRKAAEGTQVETIRGKDEEADEARRGTGVPCPYNREDRLCRDGAQLLRPYMGRIPNRVHSREWLC